MIRVHQSCVAMCQACGYKHQPCAYRYQPCVCLFTYVNEISLQVIVRELPRGTSSSKSKKAVCTVSNLHDITKFTPHIMVFLSLNITQHVRMCFSQYTCVCFTMSVYQVTLDMLTGFHFHGNIHSDMMMFMLKAGIQRRKERHNILSALRTA